MGTEESDKVGSMSTSKRWRERWRGRGEEGGRGRGERERAQREERMTRPDVYR